MADDELMQRKGVDAIPVMAFVVMKRSIRHHAPVVPVWFLMLLLAGCLRFPWCHSITVLNQQTVASGLDTPYVAVVDASRKAVFIAEYGACAVLYWPALHFWRRSKALLHVNP